MKDCNQCGKCCIKYSHGGLSAEPVEIEYWANFRPAIDRYVSAGKIWVDPDTNEQLARCPWLRQLPGTNRYGCDIYHDRPDDCKYYPVSIEQMITDDCEMLEERDRANLKLAQKNLDKRMADSRPPLE